MSFVPLIVFDLDQCLWTPETYVLSDVPTAADVILGPLGSGGPTGVVAVRCGRGGANVLRLHESALSVLQSIARGRWPHLRLAAASTSHNPPLALAALALLEVLPGVSMAAMFAAGWPLPISPGKADVGKNALIGRSGSLSASKAATHFPQLRAATGVPYELMIFFDDCNWDDHVSEVEAHCSGVIAQRTPDGLTMAEFEAALARFAAAADRRVEGGAGGGGGGGGKGASADADPVVVWPIVPPSPAAEGGAAGGAGARKLESGRAGVAAAR